MHLINVELLQTQSEQQVGWFCGTNLEIPFMAWPEPAGSTKPPAAMGGDGNISPWVTEWWRQPKC